MNFLIMCKKGPKKRYQKKCMIRTNSFEIIRIRMNSFDFIRINVHVLDCIFLIIKSYFKNIKLYYSVSFLARALDAFGGRPRFTKGHYFFLKLNCCSFLCFFLGIPLPALTFFDVEVFYVYLYRALLVLASRSFLGLGLGQV